MYEKGESRRKEITQDMKSEIIFLQHVKLLHLLKLPVRTRLYAFF